METDAIVFSTLGTIGVPVTKLAWPVGSAPELPWVAFVRERGGEVFCDNTNYHRFPRYRAELYMKENDPELIEAFEKAVGKLGTYRVYSDDFVDSEHCYLLSLEFTLLPEREANNG